MFDLSRTRPGLAQYKMPGGLRLMAGGGGSGAGYEGEDDPDESPSFAQAKKSKSKTPGLDSFGTDLTDRLIGGRDPLIGRHDEFRRVTFALARRRCPNAVLVGEAGVGRTTIVRGFAHYLGQPARHVHPFFRGKRVVELDLALMIAGTKYRGQFEERMKAVLSELRRDKGKTFVFLSNLSELVGGGAAEGGLDAGQMIKEALGRDELRMIAAIEPKWWKQLIRKDPALARRFTEIKVEPSTPEETLDILHGLRHPYESHHRVDYTDDSFQEMVTLADRYSQRPLPDAAVDLLDESGAYQRVSGIDWDVDTEVVRKVASRAYRVPLETVDAETAISLLALEERMSEVLVGQKEPISRLASSVRRNRAGLRDPKRPAGTYLFLGPTGVGKTLLSKTLAVCRGGDESHLIQLDMSEYMERNSVSRLIGAPPGYVGYEEGGQLTEKVRQRPYCVVLFDEIEKAHQDVFNLLLQIMEDGQLTDSFGRKVSFKNVIVIMTSNVGSAALRGKIGLVGSVQSAEQVARQAKEAASNEFSPEFVGRCDEVLVFEQLTDDELREVTHREIRKVEEILQSNTDASETTLKVADEVIDLILSEAESDAFGGRNIRKQVQDHVTNPLSEFRLEVPERCDVYYVQIMDGEVDVMGASRPVEAPVLV